MCILEKLQGRCYFYYWSNLFMITGCPQCGYLCVFVSFSSAGCLSGMILVYLTCPPNRAGGRSVRICACVVCACVNPSGTDSKLTGPVGIVQRCHFQVSVLTFFSPPNTHSPLSHTQTHRHRQTQLWGDSKIHRTPSARYWCFPLCVAG